MINRIKKFLQGPAKPKKNVPKAANVLSESNIEEESMETRYDVVKLDREASAAKKAIKAKFVELEGLIKSSFPEGISRQQAVLKLEEAWGWVGKSARVATEERA